MPNTVAMRARYIRKPSSITVQCDTSNWVDNQKTYRVETTQQNIW